MSVNPGQEKARKRARAVFSSSRARLAAAVESLETRVLLSAVVKTGDYNYFLSGNSLVVTSGLNPISGSPFDVTGASEVDLTGGSSSNSFTVTNFSGLVKIDGAGGSDTFTINAGGGATVDILADASATTPDTLIVKSPSSTPVNTTVSPGSITVGGDTINNADTAVSNLSLTGQVSGTGDALIINGSSAAESFGIAGAVLTITGEPQISYHSYTALTINGNGGDDSFSVNGTNGPTTLNAGAGTVNFNITSNNDFLTLNSGSTGSDTFTINGNSGTLIANGSGADDHYTVNGSTSSMTLNGGSGVNTFVVTSNSGALNLNGGTGDTSDSFDIQSSSGVIHAVGGSGTGMFEVDSVTAPVTLMGGGASDSFHVTAPCNAIITVVGGSVGAQTLEYDGSPVTDNFTITGSKISGPLQPILYSKITGLTVNGGGGDDTFNVVGDSAPTTLIGSVGNDVYNIQADSASDPVTVDTGSTPGASVVNVGSNAPANFSKLDTIAGGVIVNGDGNDTLNLDDTGSSAKPGKTGTLSTDTLSGFSAGNITYNGLDTLNLKLGSGGNTLTVAGTSASTTNINTGSGNDFVYVQSTGGTTNLNAGGGSNTLIVGSTAPTLGGTLSFIQGILNLTGNGADLLTLDDTGGSSFRTGTLNASSLTGFSPAAINYAGIGVLTLKMGNQGNNLTISATNATTTTNIDGGTGGDTILLVTDAGKTNIVAGSGANQISVDATGATTTIGDAAGSSNILIGSTAPTVGGLLSGIKSPLTVTGNANDTLTLDDTGDSAATSNGTLDAGAVKGLGMGSSGVAYSGLGTLNVNLGSGGNAFQILNTSASVGTIVNSGSGNDVVTLKSDASPVTINSGSGNDAVNVQGTGTGATTVVNLGSGTDTVYVSNNAPSAGSLQQILTQLTINGTSATTVTLDDTGDPTGRTGSLSDTELSGIAPGNIFYSGLGILNLFLGTGGNTLTVTNTSATTTNINSGAGIDIVNVNGAGASTTTNVNTGGGSNINTVNVGDPGSNVANVDGTLAITGNTHDILFIDNAASTVANTATLTATSLTGLTAVPLTWSGIANFTLSLGTQNNLLTVNSTIAGKTTLNGGPNTDTFNLLGEGGPVTVNTGAGNDTVYIPSTTAAIVVNTNTGADTINVASIAPPSGGVLSGVTASITVNGDGNDTLNLDDSGDAAVKSPVVSAGAVSGLSAGAINYNSLDTLNVYFGTANQTISVPSTSAKTNLYTGSAADTINVGSSGSTAGINGPLNIIGSAAADILNVDDSADATASNGTLNATTISGVSPQPITYSGLASLVISLGVGGNTFAINTTASGTATTLNSGTGNDTVTLVTDASLTTINTQAGSDVVYVQATGAATAINTGTPGSDTIDVGSILPPPTFNKGVLAGVQGALTVTGNGTDTLNLDDSGDATVRTGATLSATSVTGLGAAAINYSALGQLNLALGTASDTLLVTGAASGTPTNITTAGGSDIFNIRATSSALKVTTLAPGVDTFNVGSLAPATGGTISNIAGPITLAGDTLDTLNVDDSGATVARTGSLSSTVFTLGPATINYSGLAALNATLGTGADVFTINSTAVATPVTLNATVSDTFNVKQISSTTTINTGSSASTINVGNPDVLSGIGAGLIVNGSMAGADVLNVSDAGDGAAQTGTLTATTLTGLGMPVGITYSGVASLTISLGSGGNTFTITNTSATTATTLNSGAGNDTVTLTADAGPTTINTQGGNDFVYVLSTGAVTTVNTGAGTDVVDVGSIAPAIGGTLNGIKSALKIVGGGNTTANLDDTKAPGTKTANISGSSITGLSPGAITYSGLTNLNIGLGSGGDTVNVTGSSATLASVITGGVGSETFNITAPTSAGLNAVLLGPVTVDGGAGGTDVLTVDDSIDATGRVVGLSTSTTTGLGSNITFLNQNQLNLKLGAGNDTLNITGASAATPIYADGGAGTNNASLSITGAYSGFVSLTHFQSGSANVTGSFTGILTTTGNLSPLTIGGDLTGTINAGSIGTGTISGSVSGNIVVTGAIGNLTITNDVSGSISAASVSGTLKIGGNLASSGIIHVTGSLNALTITGNLAGQVTAASVGSATVGGDISGSLTVSGKLTSLSFGGNQSGTITAGAIGSITATGAAALTNGVVLSVTQAGLLRQFIASATTGLSPLSASAQSVKAQRVKSGAPAVTGPTPLPNATFKLFYDGSTLADPQLAVRVTNTGNTRFDATLTSAVGANFDLSRFDSSGSSANLRDIVVEGNVLAAPTSAQSAFLGLAAGAAGGVYLPNDAIGDLASWGNIVPGTVRVSSIQGVALATLTVGTTVYKASSLSSEGAESLLLKILAVNPSSKTTLYYGVVALPTETLGVALNVKAPVALFVDGTRGDDDKNENNGTANGGDFEEHGLLLTDSATGSAANAPITATAAFSSNTTLHSTKITQLTIKGDDATVDSTVAVQNLASTGSLVNLFLRNNNNSTTGNVAVGNITVPSILGNVDFFTATLAGTLQTTGLRTDPVTGLVGSVPADLGSQTFSGTTVIGVTTLHLSSIAATGQIVSRGNLFSQVNIDTTLLGNIASQGSIGAGVVVSGKLSRFGGIKIGSGTSTGQIAALGNIYGDVIISGGFGGRISAKGSPVSQLASSRLGILANVTLSGGLSAGGAVISGGEIGDSTSGTKLTLSSSGALGFVAAKGAVLSSATLPSGRLFQNAGGASAAAIAAIWTNGGSPLAFDVAPGDLAGLALILTDAAALKISGSTLTGTTA